jgi:hypothetical protein
MPCLWYEYKAFARLQLQEGGIKLRLGFVSEEDIEKGEEIQL